MGTVTAVDTLAVGRGALETAEPLCSVSRLPHASERKPAMPGLALHAPLIAGTGDDLEDPPLVDEMMMVL